MASHANLSVRQRALKLLISSASATEVELALHQNLRRQCVIHRSPLYSYVSDEAFEVVEGVNFIGIGITCAISPWCRRTRVEIESKVLLVLLC